MKNIFELLVLLGIICSISFGCEDCGFSYVPVENKIEKQSILIVSSVDGGLHGLNSENGDFIWSIKNSPLVSQSLSKLEFIKDAKKYRLIPSLEGQLYMLEVDGNDNALRALPITADALFSSNFQLSSDSLLVGGKDQQVFGFNPFNGEIRYRCGKNGCEQEKSFSSDRETCELLICRRVSHVVRAIALETGVEQWNFSVGQDDVVSFERVGMPQHPLANVHDNGDDSHNNSNDNRKNSGRAVSQRSCTILQGGRDSGQFRFSFGVEAGLIEASLRPPFSRLLWRRQLDASLSRVWLLEDGVVTQLALFAGDSQGRIEHIFTNDAGCPRRRALFLGAYRGHMYVQLEDGNALTSPRPNYVSLDSQNPSDNEMHNNRQSLDRSLSRRHRVARMTRHEVTVFKNGFFRSPLQDVLEPGDAWFVDHGRQEYYPPSTEPLVIRYGSFVFQKLVLFALVLVVGHLVFTHLYLPHQLSKCRSLPTVVSNSIFSTMNNTEYVSQSISTATTDSGVAVITTSDMVLAASIDVKYESRYDTDYEHVRCLGRGAFGVVFEACHRVDQYSYAIKRVRVRYSEEARTQLLREVKAFAHLEHPGIVRYYQAWFELPPPGWQEKRDEELGLRSTGSGDSGDWVNNSLDASEPLSTRCMNSGDWSHDQDSLIIFDRSALSRPSSKISCTPDPSSEGMGGKTGSMNCSHLYLYISMHLYSSPSLKDWLQQQQTQNSRPPVSELLHIFAQIVDAVAYLHSNGLMHRDLKPSNILFDDRNHIRIVDFGLATSLKKASRSSCLRSHNDNTTTVITIANGNSHMKVSGSHSDRIADGDSTVSFTGRVGTELYMSPEQCAGDTRYDHKVDVFALGVIFIELVVPLGTAMERALVLSRARLSQFDSWIETAFPNEVAFARRLLHQDPSKRPSCEEIFEDPLLIEAADTVRMRHRHRSVSSAPMVIRHSY